MSKELAPLEALEKLKYHSDMYYEDFQLFNIIENALKENAELKQMIRNFNEAIGEPMIITPSIEKKLKALEIIKREAGYGISFDGQSSDGIYGVCIDGYIECNKDEYDLLKEVLL